jgi:hypothetical protein
MQSRQNENKSRGERQRLGHENQTLVQLVPTETRQRAETDAEIPIEAIGIWPRLTAESGPAATQDNRQVGRDRSHPVRLRHHVRIGLANYLLCRLPSQSGQLGYSVQRSATVPHEGMSRAYRSGHGLGDRGGCEPVCSRGEVSVHARQLVGRRDSVGGRVSTTPKAVMPKRIRIHRPIPPSCVRAPALEWVVPGPTREPGARAGVVCWWMPLASGGLRWEQHQG